MSHTVRSRRGMVVAPHHLAAGTGRRVLEQGGSAVEAMVAAAATIAVVYPHMNSVAGDGFWTIKPVGREPISIYAAGPTPSQLDVNRYLSRQQPGSAPLQLPARGGAAALTVAGTVSGWRSALALISGDLEFHGDRRVRETARTLQRSAARRVPLRDLLADACFLARDGVPLYGSYCRTLAAKRDELCEQPGFSEVFLKPDGTVPARGDVLRQPRLANLLEQLARDGLDSFYRGDIAVALAEDLRQVGSPITREDLREYSAELRAPLELSTSVGRFWNTGAPTQGPYSLAIVGIFDRLWSGNWQAESFAHLQSIIEGTKRTFADRDRDLCDPRHMRTNDSAIVERAYLDRCVSDIRAQVAVEDVGHDKGDTVYLAAIDSEGTAVSFIQSIYWEFGSGVVLPRTGVLWQNRGVSFSLDQAHANYLRPGAFPRHTLNPAMFEDADGSVMVYGTMGGDGQPQTQAAIATRVLWFQRELQESVSAPRWLYGRTWGAGTTSLKLELGVPDATVQQLASAGYEIEIVDRYSDLFGHAAALRRTSGGTLEGAADPRSDGSVAAY